MVVPKPRENCALFGPPRPNSIAVWHIVKLFISWNANSGFAARSPSVQNRPISNPSSRSLACSMRATTPLTTVERQDVDENTGETFTFTEKLHANADFVPDLQPADVDKRTRALADLCHVLFNTNEFIYVY